MLPPAPARLSTMTWWPHSSLRFCAITRAITSVGPAGANGTIMRTGRDGYAASPAHAGTAANAVASSNAKGPRLGHLS